MKVLIKILVILKMKMIEKNGRVLDLGCGTGSASLELLKNGFIPFPVDASVEMIKVTEAVLKIKPRRISFDDASAIASLKLPCCEMAASWATLWQALNIRQVMISPIAPIHRDNFMILPCQSSNHFNDFFSDFKGYTWVLLPKV